MSFVPSKVMFSTGAIATGYFWAKTSSFFRINDIEIDQNDNIYLGGTVGSTSQMRPYIGKYDNELTQGWGRRRSVYGSYAAINKIKCVSSGSNPDYDWVFAQGMEHSSNNGTHNPTITRFRPDATQDWDKKFSNSDDCYNLGISGTSSNVNIMMTGNNYSQNPIHSMVYTMDYQGSGVYRASRIYGEQLTRAIVGTPEYGTPNRFVLGMERSSNNKNFAFCRQWNLGQGSGTDISGAIGDYGTFTMSHKLTSSNHSNRLFGFGRESGEHMMMMGWSAWINSGDSNTLLFAKGYRFNSESSCDACDSFYVQNEQPNGTNYVYNAFVTGTSGWVTKHNWSNGNIIWARRFQLDGQEFGRISIAQDSNYDIWVAGYATGGNLANKGFVAKIPNDGSYTGTYGDFDYSNYSSVSTKTGISRNSSSNIDHQFATYSPGSPNTSWSSSTISISEEEGLK